MTAIPRHTSRRSPRRDWNKVEQHDFTPPGQPTRRAPVVYVAVDSQASYFLPGEHVVDGTLDDSALGDGQLRDAGIGLEILNQAPPWIQWPGKWGDDAGVRLVPRASPISGRTRAGSTCPPPPLELRFVPRGGVCASAAPTGRPAEVASCLQLRAFRPGTSMVGKYGSTTPCRLSALHVRPGASHSPSRAVAVRTLTPGSTTSPRTAARRKLTFPYGAGAPGPFRLRLDAVRTSHCELGWQRGPPIGLPAPMSRPH